MGCSPLFMNHLESCSSHLSTPLPPLSSSRHPKYCSVLFSNLPFVLPYASSLNMIELYDSGHISNIRCQKKEKRAKILIYK